MLLGDSLVMGLLMAWVVVTAFLLIIWMWRSFVGQREDDVLFLDKAEAHLVREQREVIAKLDRLRPYFLGSLTASIILAVTTFGVWVYQQLQ